MCDRANVWGNCLRAADRNGDEQDRVEEFQFREMTTKYRQAWAVSMVSRMADTLE